jgi:hypothetical protein
MMKVIRKKMRLDSTTIHLPELKDMIGKNVVIIIVEQVPALSVEENEERIKI